MICLMKFFFLSHHITVPCASQDAQAQTGEKFLGRRGRGRQKFPMESASNARGYPFGYSRAACWGRPKPRTGRFRVRPNAPFGAALRSLRSLDCSAPRGRRTARSAPFEITPKPACPLVSAWGRNGDFGESSPTLIQRKHPVPGIGFR